VEQNRAFAQKYDFPFLLLCDTDRTIALAYGAVDSLDARAAKRISYLVAPDGTIAQVYAKVNVTEHANELLDSLGS
jgi:peroxiredoxin Q/BCP